MYKQIEKYPWFTEIIRPRDKSTSSRFRVKNHPLEMCRTCRHLQNNVKNLQLEHGANLLYAASKLILQW